MPYADGSVVWAMWVRGTRNTHLWSVKASPRDLDYRGREMLAHHLREARRRLRVHVAADRDVAKLIRDVCSQNFTDRT